ncbi:hypothetical protein [Pseudotamlana agarivorans]|uniref:hypothetical protein n=1 Tax=Pseudotamlana agarivorans TaxID=481183 RepID=UPI000836C982|nr:hypothetical protein [Tamlana agarivorans]
MEISTILFIVMFLFIFFYMLGKGNSKKSTILDGASRVAGFAEKTTAGASEILKINAVESEIKKVKVEGDFNIRYQPYNHLLLFWNNFSHQSFRIEQLDERLEAKLMEEAKGLDLKLIQAVENNKRLHEIAINRGISNVIIFGCTIIPFNSTKWIKDSSTIAKFKVTPFGLQREN